jgi:hypothetical protein
MQESQMHLFAALGAAALSAALIVPTVWLTEAKADTSAPLEEMESIEASLAYKKPNAPKQPQKKVQAPPPEVKPEGVSHDENKKPPDEPKKPEDKKPPKPDTPVDPLAKYHRDLDPDTDIGKPNETVGAFDGSEFGIGDVTKGDPYFQRLVVDLAWASPELAKSGAVSPVGCIHLTAEGKIPETTFKVKGDDDIATLAEAALKELKQKRNEKPEEVPTHLLKQLTTRWICFKFTVKSSE